VLSEKSMCTKLVQFFCGSGTIVFLIASRAAQIPTILSGLWLPGAEFSEQDIRGASWPPRLKFGGGWG